MKEGRWLGLHWSSQNSINRFAAFQGSPTPEAEVQRPPTGIAVAPDEVLKLRKRFDPGLAHSIILHFTIDSIVPSGAGQQLVPPPSPSPVIGGENL